MPDTTPSPRLLTGKCLCERVEYRVADKFRYAMNCYCSQCRRATGSAFKAMAGIETDALTISRGEEFIRKYGDDAGHDAHCGACGSLLYSLVREGAFVHVAMGTLVDDPTIRPASHIFVGSKARWVEITDALPQFDALPEP